MNDEAFWMVWNPQGHSPSRRHDSEESAIAEAERLARTHPGAKFYVLEAAHLRTVDSMMRVRLERPLPF